ncbi:uncharacterized protein LOC143245181 isoform X3 [Tachypleus tridentatus]|uniref:uncharacterized protein LOC143245181 isoform X3 n=1 Tax=Tachypleus tridentatus TaxID=6853 RepID=UPI003FCEEE18
MRVRCLCACRALLLLYSVTLFVKTQPLSVTIDDFRSRETPHDDEIEKDIEIMKRRLLRELGMSETPEVSEVNISKSEMDRVLEIYHQNAQIADSEEMMGEYDTIRQFYTFRDQDFQQDYFYITQSAQAKF